MKIAITTALVLTGLTFAGCGQPTASGSTEGVAAAREVAAPAAKTATGAGTVTAVDAVAGTVTIDHGPIAEAGWPAMTMAFETDPPALADQVRSGDKVAFDVSIGGGAPVVTGIRPQ